VSDDVGNMDSRAESTIQRSGNTLGRGVYGSGNNWMKVERIGAEWIEYEFKEIGRREPTTGTKFGQDRRTRAISTEEFWDAHGGCISNTRCCGMDRSRAKDRPRVQSRVRHLSKSQDLNRCPSLRPRDPQGEKDKRHCGYSELRQ
jgi:hypothetical protein